MGVFLTWLTFSFCFSVLLPFLQYFVFAMKNIVVVFGMNPVVWIRLKMKEIIQIRRDMGVSVFVNKCNWMIIFWNKINNKKQCSKWANASLFISFTGKCQYVWFSATNAVFQSEGWKPCLQWERDRRPEHDLPAGGIRNYQHGPGFLQPRAGAQPGCTEETVRGGGLQNRRGTRHFKKAMYIDFVLW